MPSSKPAFQTPPANMESNLRAYEAELLDQLPDMPLAEHLKELRYRVILCLAVLLGVFVLSFSFYAERLLVFLMAPVQRLGVEFVYISLGDALSARFLVSLLVAFLISFPFLLWQGYSFVKLGLYPRERQHAGLVMTGASVLFLAGISFGFFLVFAAALGFLLYQNDSLATTMLSVNMYIHSLVSFVLPFGIAFELPLFCYFLHKLGLLESSTLKRHRKIMILVIFIIAALLTPPDVLSQIMLAVPLLLLYELSIRLIA